MRGEEPCAQAANPSSAVTPIERWQKVFIGLIIQSTIAAVRGGYQLYTDDNVVADWCARLQRLNEIMGQASDVLDVPVLYLTYQYLVGGIKARHRCITEHVRTKPGERVLDIGCGPGYVTRWLVKGTQYVGLD